MDTTGLTGKFDFPLEFAPQTPGALPPESPDFRVKPRKCRSQQLRLD